MIYNTDYFKNICLLASTCLCLGDIFYMFIGIHMVMPWRHSLCLLSSTWLYIGDIVCVYWHPHGYTLATYFICLLASTDPHGYALATYFYYQNSPFLYIKRNDHTKSRQPMIRQVYHYQVIGHKVNRNWHEAYRSVPKKPFIDKVLENKIYSTECSAGLMSMSTVKMTSQCQQ